MKRGLDRDQGEQPAGDTLLGKQGRKRSYLQSTLATAAAPRSRLQSLEI